MAEFEKLANNAIVSIKTDFCNTIAKKVIAYMDPFVLSDTGATRQSAYATQDTSDGSVVVTYDTAYAADAYNMMPGSFTPSTSGTNSQWGAFFEDSFEFQLLLRSIDEDVTSGLNNVFGG